MKSYQKILLGLFIGILILLAGTQIYLSFFVDDQLKNTAIERFHSATDNSYDLEIEDLDLEVVGRRLSLSNIKITPKQDSGGTDIRFTLDDLNISGIGLMNYLFWNQLSLNQIELINPQVYITSSGSDKSSKKQFNWSRPSQRLSEKALEIFNQVTIDDFQIRNLSLDYNRADLPVNPYLSFQNSDIRWYDITIDSTSMTDERVIPSENIALTVRELRHQTSNELYDLTAQKVAFSSTNSTLNVDTLKLSPKFDKQDFSKKVGHEIDRMDIEIPQILWNGIDIPQLNRAERLAANHVTVTAPDIDVFRDKRLPEDPDNRPPLPQDMINNIPFPISIDSIGISEGTIRYSARVPKAERTGYIEFSTLSATLENITNIKEQWANGQTPLLKAETDIMGQARLTAEFSFNMTDRDKSQQIKGNLQSMDMQPLNNTLEPMAFVRIDNGRILGMDFQMHLTETKATGDLTLRYEDFKISLLDKESNEETFGNMVKSLLANTLKIKSENKGDDLRVGTVEFERAEEKSVFNYWWKSLLSGLKSSIGL